MNYFVTGITGFAAPHLAKLLLSKGHTVTALVRCSNGRENDLLDILSPDEINSIKFVYGDLSDYCSIEDIIKSEKFDGVFHMAAQSHVMKSFEQPILTHETNVMGSINLVTCVEKYQDNCKFQFCSSSEVYGDICKDTGILQEDMIMKPVNPYAVSKAAFDLYMQERINNGFIDGIITRAFSHTGPRRGFNFSISSDAFQIAKMMLGKQEPTLLIGNLKTKRVVMDVYDCVNAYYLLMINPNTSGVYNVCGEGVQEMQHFTDLLIKHSGRTDIVQKIHKPFYRDIDIQVQIGDVSRLKAETNWQQTVDIDTTMKNLLDYWVKKLG